MLGTRHYDGLCVITNSNEQVEIQKVMYNVEVVPGCSGIKITLVITSRVELSSRTIATTCLDYITTRICFSPPSPSPPPPPPFTFLIPGEYSSRE